jgi:hypothetical protein
MAAAAILKAVGHFRCCIFDYGWKTQNYSSNFIAIGQKLNELLQFELNVKKRYRFKKATLYEREVIKKQKFFIRRQKLPYSYNMW